MLLIALFGLVVLLGGGFGVLIASHFLSVVLGVAIPARVIDRAMHAAFVAVFGLAVTSVGVLVHASGATNDSQARRPTV